MLNPSLVFITIHGLLLSLFREVRGLSAHHALPIIRSRLEEVRAQIVERKDLAALLVYEHNLNFYAKKFKNIELYKEFTIIDPGEIKKELAVDPSRFDCLLSLAIHYIATDQRMAARATLQKISMSKFCESEFAQHLLVSTFEESLQCYLS